MTKQHIQELCNQRAEAVNHRNNINKESYYYYDTIATKHYHHWLRVWESNYWTYDKIRRFRQGDYDRDITAANERINNLETRINSLRQQEAAEEQVRQQALAVEQARQRAIAEEKARLESIERARLDAIEQEKQQKIAAEKARLAAEAAEQARLDAVKHGNDVISANISKQQKANFDMFQSLNSKQRAFFLSELFSKSDNESMTMISIIKSLGVDADELAYYAIKKTHSGLFDLALSYGANCCNYSVAGKTLLQQLIHSGNESFIKKVLATGQDLASTVVEAIGQNDIVTISKLSSYDSSLLSQKFAGYTLLQIAISAQKTEIVQKILQLGSNSVEILTNNAESALKIAVRSGNDEIIKMVAQHANLQVEIAQLGPKVEQALKDKILEYQDIETVIKLLRGEEISLQQYLLTKQNHSRTTEEGVVTVGEEARLETMKQAKQQKQDCNDEQLVNSTSLQEVIHIESLESQFDKIHLIGDNAD
ncbi:ankyrin repeat domain-containing protein [Candidatus Tisiphia endosymbiont of Temnostethus pusillus]|uniref:ankyrin repeat domain-containing protein n=1 Tax=Candidatus Tisiphia endosymbiont of Temnostethus pusillus TaxID=3139335 RepID=UPI0035C8C69E